MDDFHSIIFKRDKHAKENYDNWLAQVRSIMTIKTARLTPEQAEATGMAILTTLGAAEQGFMDIIRMAQNTGDALNMIGITYGLTDDERRVLIHRELGNFIPRVNETFAEAAMRLRSLTVRAQRLNLPISPSVIILILKNIVPNNAILEIPNYSNWENNNNGAPFDAYLSMAITHLAANHGAYVKRKDNQNNKNIAQKLSSRRRSLVLLMLNRFPAISQSLQLRVITAIITATLARSALSWLEHRRNCIS